MEDMRTMSKKGQEKDVDSTTHTFTHQLPQSNAAPISYSAIGLIAPIGLRMGGRPGVGIFSVGGVTLWMGGEVGVTG